MELISKDTPYGLSFAMSAIPLLCFTALVFLGLDYHYEGNLLIVIPIVVISTALIVWSVVRMCRYKHTQRFQEGIAKEAAFAVLVFVLLILESMPFSNFMRVLDRKDDFQAAVDSTVIVVKGVGTAYQDYANERIQNYRRHTRNAAKVESLKRRLLNDDMKEIEMRRTEWLDSLHAINVWNILTPRNIAAVGNAAAKWVGEYAAVSQMIYEGEDCEPFSMPQLEGELTEMTAAFTEFRGPDARGLFAALICFAFVLTPYVLIRRNTKGKVGTHGS